GVALNVTYRADHLNAEGSALMVYGSIALNPKAHWPFLVGLLLPLTVYLLRRLVLVLRGERPARAQGPITVAKPRPRLEVALRGLVALTGVALVSVVIPNSELQWLCFPLACWLALHSLLLYFFRYRRIPDAELRRMHRRAGLAFGLFFLVYMALFLVYWYDRSGELAAWLAPPALVCFLLLCLVVTMHGFLHYHFRGWYALVVLALFALIGFVNGLPRYKLHFPGLDYEQRVQLLDADAEGRYAQLVKRMAELRAEPAGEARTAVLASFGKLMFTQNNL